ncbi:MAG: hypothetical protein IKQ20_03515 [Bacteroidales bacterium]|nr:hypothetical protein [Bacteroidales bacterium]
MDKLLEMCFDLERWQYAIDKGIGKDIRRDQLYQLAKPEVRAAMYLAIKDGRYKISPPHTAQIPKDTPGEFRTVYVNEPIDRVFLSITNDLLFETCPEMIHPRCKSYQKGIGCGKVVQEISRKIMATSGDIIGWKSDFSKYFDTVPIRLIDRVFDQIEEKVGKSAVITVLRDYYHTDLYFDENNTLQSKYQSLKQGCAVAAFLADAVLYDLDERLSSLDGDYTRYSDDSLYIGEDYEKAMTIMKEELEDKGMSLNPKKVEYITKDKWFKFLGFSIKGSDISLSSSRIKTFQKEIEARTIKDRKVSLKKAVNAVNNYLYKGNGEFSWATQILSICNVREDINTLNAFVMDCLRAVSTGKRRIGGLGYVRDQKVGCIVRGRGKNVTANRQKTDKQIDGYLTLGCMQNAMITRRAAYNTLVASL